MGTSLGKGEPCLLPLHTRPPCYSLFIELFGRPLKGIRSLSTGSKRTHRCANAPSPELNLSFSAYVATEIQMAVSRKTAGRLSLRVHSSTTAAAKQIPFVSTFSLLLCHQSFSIPEILLTTLRADRRRHFYQLNMLTVSGRGGEATFFHTNI